MRRQSVLLLDELSPIESSASSLASSNSQHTNRQRRRLPTIGNGYSHRVSRPPFMQSQSSTLSLPISQPPNFNRRSNGQEFGSNPVNTFQYKDFDKRLGFLSGRESSSPKFPRPDHYPKHRVGHRASLQQQQQIIEPHLRQMRRYQSHLSDMSPSRNTQMPPPPPAPPTPPIQPSTMRPLLRNLNSELPLRMAQYNCIQQQLNSGSNEFVEESPSPRHQRFYSAAAI